MPLRMGGKSTCAGAACRHRGRNGRTDAVSPALSDAMCPTADRRLALGQRSFSQPTGALRSSFARAAQLHCCTRRVCRCPDGTAPLSPKLPDRAQGRAARSRFGTLLSGAGLEAVGVSGWQRSAVFWPEGGRPGPTCTGDVDRVVENSLPSNSGRARADGCLGRRAGLATAGHCQNVLPLGD